MENYDALIRERTIREKPPASQLQQSPLNSLINTSRFINANQTVAKLPNTASSGEARQQFDFRQVNRVENAWFKNIGLTNEACKFAKK
jgi:hypothetical protein